MPPRKGDSKKGKPKMGQKSASKQEMSVVAETVIETVETETQPAPQDANGGDQQQAAEASSSPQAPVSTSTPVLETTSEASEPAKQVTDPPTDSNLNMTMDERVNKLNALRLRMRQAAQANRADLISESQQLKISTKDAARLEKQRKLHEILRLKADAEERGEDAERSKNWEYTIEENDEWEKRLRRKKTRADFEFHDDAHAARRKYKKDLDHLKLDLIAYNAQKEAAMGYAPGTLVQGTTSPASHLNNMQLMPVSHQQQLASEHLYRDANTLLYADNKPSEEAIDRVVSKLNLDLDKRGKRSRKRLHEDDGDITYINERNRVFNKKIARYYDKYTAEIRASFERGTAL